MYYSVYNFRVFLTAMTREFASPWQFFPDWMYRYLSPEGRQWYKDIEYVRQVGKKVGHLFSSNYFQLFYI